MNITDVRMHLHRRDSESRLKAYADITIDGEFVVHDIKVIQGDSGLFMAMPSRKMADDRFIDIAHPINSEARTKLQDIIMEAYEKAVAEDDGLEEVE